MPIEIKELIINATVSEETKKKSGDIDLAGFKKRILDECVERVMLILESKKER